MLIKIFQKHQVIEVKMVYPPQKELRIQANNIRYEMAKLRRKMKNRLRKADFYAGLAANDHAKQLRYDANLFGIKIERFLREANRLETLAANKEIPQDKLLEHARKANDSRLNYLAVDL